MVCVLAPLVFVFCCALTTSRCNAFPHSFVNQKKSEFYGPSFLTMLFLVTMIQPINKTAIHLRGSVMLNKKLKWSFNLTCEGKTK